MIEGQTYEVDAVSGAIITSDGFYQFTERASERKGQKISNWSFTRHLER